MDEIDQMTRRLNSEHDTPMTREVFDEIITDALKHHRPPTDWRPTFSIILSIVVFLGGTVATIMRESQEWTERMSRVEERQLVSSGLIKELAEKLDRDEQLLINNQTQIIQLNQELHDHVEHEKLDKRR